MQDKLKKLRRIEKLYDRGIFTQNEYRHQILDLISPDNVKEVLEHLSPDFADQVVHRGLDSYLYRVSGGLLFWIQAGTFYELGYVPEHEPVDPSCSDRAIWQWARHAWDIEALDQELTLAGLQFLAPAAGAVVPALCEAMRHPVARVRKAALRALQEVEDPPEPALRVLLEQFFQEGTDRREPGLLKYFGPTAAFAVPQLCREFSENRSPFEQAAVARVLGRIGPAAESASKALLGWLQRSDSLDHRLIALAALAKILGARFGDRQELGETARIDVEKGLHAQAAKYSGESPRVLALVVLACLPATVRSTITDEQAPVATLIDELPRLDGFNSWREGWHPHAIKTVGLMGNEAHAAVKPLTELLLAPSFFDRATVAEALGNIGPESGSAVWMLLQMLNDENPLVRRKAVEALWRIGVPEKYHGTIASYLYDHNAAMRGWSALILARSNAEFENVRDGLIARLHDPHPAVHVAAAAAIGRYGQRAKDATPELRSLFGPHHGCFADHYPGDLVVRAAVDKALADIG